MVGNDFSYVQEPFFPTAADREANPHVHAHIHTNINWQSDVERIIFYAAPPVI